jgi:hypothetical protein
MRQDAHFIRRRRAAFGVCGVVREVRRAGHVQPVPLPATANPVSSKPSTRQGVARVLAPKRAPLPARRRTQFGFRRVS